MNTVSRPPLHTVLTELTAWTLQRSASLPKSQRFTFGQRLDNGILDAVLLVTRVIWSPPSRKRILLDELNLQLELLRVLWRLVHDQHWISQQQLVFVMAKIDEAGRMTGGWLRQLGAREVKSGS